MKRLISFVLILALLTSLGLGGALAAGSGEGGRYADVAESAWYYGDVLAAYELGLMEGVGEGSFAPAEPLSLAQAVTLAARARSLYLKDGETFPRHDEWYRVYVEYAIAGGIPVSADEDFDAPATRRRCAELFAAALPKSGLRAINRVDDGAIPDVEADAAVYTLYRAGVMIGDETHAFHPDDSIRRCEIAAVVNRLLRAENRLSVTLTLAREETEPEPEQEQESGQDPGPSFLIDEDPVEFELPKPEPVEEVFDAEGNSSVPYDLSHPEEFASGEVLYADETILIKFRLPFDGEVDASLRAAGVEKLEKLMDLEEAAWYTAYLRAGTDVHEAVETVRGLRGVMLVEYDFVYAADGPVTDSGEISGEVAGNERLDEQWYINSVGIQAAWQLQLGSKSQLFLPKMLEENPEGEIPEDPQDPVLLSGGSSDVVVAVIDTGVDCNHPDLRANMWHNPGEIPENGIDDDGNGYVDDYYGVDIVAGGGSGNDDHGHGTHVAGIIAAVNNAEGIVGIAYNARIMSVKAGMSSGYFSNSAIAAAVIYAADNGADVINMSFGGSAISIAVQDALSYAYTRCVLVAAAGNEGVGNDVDHPKPGDSREDKQNYPAALPYVLGVMSVDRYGNLSSFSNFDCIPFNNYEYEVYAPGEAMLSTIPGNRYAAWNGTSMAAPVVSAVAALLRSEFRERSTYPTKFIYGQLSGTGPLGPDGYHRIVNAYSALTVLPRPDVQVTDYRLFDTAGFAADAAGVNNGDGVIDAGETVALGFFLRNHWGMAKNVTVSVDALSPAGIPCPYLEVLTEEADYGSVGTYSVQDAGQIMEDGLFTGWENPIYLTVSEDCPDGYIIALNVLVTAENALDAEDGTIYSCGTQLLLTVRRGVLLPESISEDMTLTSDNRYIISNSTTIQTGVTVTVEPGTEILFWSDDHNDAYADQYMASLTVKGTLLVNGTAEAPVVLRPSDGMASYVVSISCGNSGSIMLRHAVVTNPSISVDYAEGCEFRQNARTLHNRSLSGSTVSTSTTGSSVAAAFAEDCVFYKMYLSMGILRMKGCAFIDCSTSFSSVQYAENNLFYGNNDIWSQNSYISTSSYEMSTSGYSTDYKGSHVSLQYHPRAFSSVEVIRQVRDPATGTWYLLVSTGNQTGQYLGSALAMERLAEALGGSLACPVTQETRDFLMSQNLTSAHIGLYLDPKTGSLAWTDGSPYVSETWNSPDVVIPYRSYVFTGTSVWDANSSSSYWLIQIPGDALAESITLPEQLSLSTEESCVLQPEVWPTAAAGDLRYFSGCEAIATVDENGVVTPVGPGSTRIYVYSPDMQVSASLMLTVWQPVPAAAIAFAEESVTLSKGENLALALAVTPSYCTELPVFSSSDETVATVDEAGNLTALEVGTCTVTATIPGTALDAEISVTVRPRLVSLSFRNDMICLLPQEGLSAEEALGLLLSQDGEGEIALTWASANTDVLTVDEYGELQFFSQGATDARWALLRVTAEDYAVSAEVMVCASTELVDSSVTDMGRIYWNNNGANTTYNFAVLADGSAWYWGSGRQLPEQIPLPGPVKQLVHYSPSDYAQYLFALNPDGELNVYRWGDLTLYNYPLGTADNQPLTGVSQICSGRNGKSTYILMEDGSVWAVGNNNYHQLGDGSTTNRSTIVQADTQSIGRVTGLATGIEYGVYPLFAVRTEDGKAWYVGGYNSTASFTQFAEGVTGFWRFYADQGDTYFLTFCGDSVVGGTSFNTQTFAFVGDAWYGSNASNQASGVTIRDGLAYRGAAADEAQRIPGLSEIDSVFLLGSTWYFQADEGFFGMGGNANAAIPNLSEGTQNDPSRIRFGLTAPAALSLEGTNLTEDGDTGSQLLVGPELVLDFSAALLTGDNYSTVTLRAQSGSGQALSLRRTVDLDKLALSPLNGFIPGETYTLSLPASAVKDHFNSTNSALTLTFTYEGDAPAEPGQPEQPEQPGEPEQPVTEYIDDIADGITVLPEPTPRTDTLPVDVDAVVAEFISKGLNTTFINNAVINRLKDDDVGHWLRFTAPNGSSIFPLGSNYWGTVNETLIGLQIVDNNDYSQLSDIDEGEYLATAPETVWPFAVNAGLIDAGGAETDVIGNETVTFFVEFNRDMDTETPLRVRFGSAYPYADYEVEGGWVSDRRWEGTTTLTTIIENGYQFWSIGSGQSADGKKLYEDWGRFRFEIDNTAAMAMTMQGSAGPDGVLLTWTQDDFDTLMGYNVYRAESLNGQYTRLNGTVIPAETTSWFDANVEPGVVYYYNFTVVKTDMNESAPSGRISIMTLDTMAPVLTHSPVYTAFSGNSLTISATVTDNVGVDLVTLYYRVTGESGWHSAEMSRFNDRYSAVISSNYVTTAGLEYYIDAYDGVSHALRGSAEEPFAVTVQVAVADSDKGDVNGDGRISSVDALMLLRAINGRLNLTAEQFARADINGDGELTAAEAMRILQYANGKISTVLY